MDFNKEQQLAIEKRGNSIGNILVSAGAGSGKTAVLAERVIRLITDSDNPIDIDKLLILTFTKNAASEMRQRISSNLKRLRDKLFFEAPTSAEYLTVKKQLSILNRANITTIDSFCNTVVRKYFYKINIDPGYRIAGDDSCTELSRLSNEAMDELFEAHFAANDTAFIELIEYFCPKGYDNKNLKNILVRLTEVLSSVPNPRKWLDESLSVYVLEDNEFLSSKMSKHISDYLKIALSKVETKLNKAEKIINEVNNNSEAALYVSNKQLLKENGKAKSDYKFVIYENNFAKAREIVNSLAENSDYEAVYNAFDGDFTRLTGGKLASDTPELLIDGMQQLGALWTDFKKNFYDKLKIGLFNTPPQQLREIIQKQYKVISSLFTLYTEYEQSYSAKKNELSLASFSDIGHYCIQILLDDNGSPTPEAIELSNTFAEVIVDEYQDINTIQECILTALANAKSNMFMVGDIKQSIYKFRHACPEIFAEKYNTYNHSNLSSGNICICLNRNYRSRKSVLDFINFVFYQTMCKTFGGIDYTEADALKAGAEFPQSDLPCCTKNELIICNSSQPDTTDYDEYDPELAEIEELADNEAEAHIIAQRISDLVDEHNPTYIYDAKQQAYRPCRLSDITILMRSPNKAAYTYSSILSHYGIPSISSSKYTLFNELEVRTVMSLLKVIDNPYRDRDLITALHCPIYNVSCSELAVLKLVDINAPMYDNVLKYIEQHNRNDILANKLVKFTDFLNTIHTLMLSKPFCEILSYILVSTDYLNYLNIIKNSSIRITNIKLLTSMAEQIYNSGITDFGGIIASLCDIEQENPVFESSGTSDFENAVRILSIHKSKGLEFPVVFVAQFDKNLSKMSTPEETLIDADFGIALKHFDTEARLKTDFPYKTTATLLAKHNELMEELRLLYVALTRAKEKLIMVAVPKKYDERINKWKQYSEYCENGTYLPLSAIAEATSYLDWIMLAYYRRNTFKTDINIDDIFEIRTTDISSVSTDSFGTEHIKGIYSKISEKSAPKAETKALNQRLSGAYLDMVAVTLPSKISISEIKRQSRIAEYKSLEYNLTALDAPSSGRILQKLSQNKDKDTRLSFKAPAFMQEDNKVLYGAERGTAYHTVFEHLKTDCSSSLDDITKQIESLYEKKLLSTAEFNSVKPEKFVKYLQSELGKRICKAERVYRETPFVMQLSPSEIYHNASYAETPAKMLIHGIIDLYFEEDNELVLVDYKTDIVNKANPSWAICDRYKIQLEYYKNALELSTEKKVKEMYLYLVDIDQAIKLNDE